MLKKYVNRISYISYATIYSCEGSVGLDLTNRACFSNVLCYRSKLQKEHYEIILVRDPRFATVNYKSNLCLLNDRELRKHLWLVRRLFPFEYNVTEVQYEGYSAYQVTLDVDAPYFYHKYLLTWLRYAYEFPYNIILNEALRLKHQALPHESIANLFILCANSYNNAIEYYSPGHAITDPGSGFLKEYELKAKINEIAGNGDFYTQHCNNIYPITGKKFQTIPDKSVGCYLDYWTDPDAFEKRKKVYLSNYKTIKE